MNIREHKQCRKLKYLESQNQNLKKSWGPLASTIESIGKHARVGATVNVKGTKSGNAVIMLRILLRSSFGSSNQGGIYVRIRVLRNIQSKSFTYAHLNTYLGYVLQRNVLYIAAYIALLLQNLQV